MGIIIYFFRHEDLLYRAGVYAGMWEQQLTKAESGESDTDLSEIEKDTNEEGS